MARLVHAERAEKWMAADFGDQFFLTGDDPGLWAAKEFIAAEQHEREAVVDAFARGGFADAARG